MIRAVPERGTTATLADPHAETLPSDPHADRDGENLDALVGCTLGHFRLDARLGRGGMGAVYRAWDSSFPYGRDVALKVLLGASDASRERFLREARVQAKLRHPNVVPIHFVGVSPTESGEVSFLVMDIVEGETLAELLAKRGTLDELGTARRHPRTADRALLSSRAKPRSLVHRDVKPSNILDRQEKSALMLAGLRTLQKTVADPPADAPLAKNRGRGRHLSRVVLERRERRAPPRAGSILRTPAYIAPGNKRVATPWIFPRDMYSARRDAL